MESLSSLIQSPLLSPLFPLLAGACAVAVVWWRAGSVDSVLERLWRLVAGRGDAQDPVVRDWLQEIRDVEKFRYASRLRVDSLADVHVIDAWRRSNKIGLSRLRRVRRWLDPRSEAVLREPPARYASRRHSVAVAWTVLAGVAMILLVVPDQACFRMRESGVWFRTDGATVGGLTDRWTLDAAACREGRERVRRDSGLVQREVDVLCEALGTPSFRAVVAKNLAAQRGLGGAAALAAFVGVVVAVMAAAAARDARQLVQELAARRAAGATEPKDD